MKKLLFVTMLLFTSYVSANWEVNQNGVAVQAAKDDYRSLAILELVDGVYYVSFVDYASLTTGAGCDEGKDTIREVNGQPIKLRNICDRGSNRFYGLTDKGRNFIVNEFKTKNSVKFGSKIYSAIGFSSAMEKLKQREAWEKNAL